MVLAYIGSSCSCSRAVSAPLHFGNFSFLILKYNRNDRLLSCSGNHFSCIQRIPLDFLEIGSFRQAADNYVRPLLRKVHTFSLIVMLLYIFANTMFDSCSFYLQGVPSLFSDLKPLYNQPGKVKNKVP